MQPEQQPEKNERRLEEELETLGQELGFTLEQPGEGQSDEKPLEVGCLIHAADAPLWHQIHRHLALVRVPGHPVQWNTFCLNSGPSCLLPPSLVGRLQQKHLIVLVMSLDLAEAIVKSEPLLGALSAEECPLVLPISLRPVHWTPPFMTLDPAPALPVTLWRNQDAARATVAKTVFRALSGLTSYLEAGGDEGADGGEAHR